MSSVEVSLDHSSPALKGGACSREEFTAILEGRKFLFTLLAHNDQTAPQLEFSSSSPVLQVCKGRMISPLSRLTTREPLQDFYVVQDLVLQ